MSINHIFVYKCPDLLGWRKVDMPYWSECIVERAHFFLLFILSLFPFLLLFQCWLKKQKDVLAPDQHEAGKKVMWTSGIVFGRGEVFIIIKSP